MFLYRLEFFSNNINSYLIIFKILSYNDFCSTSEQCCFLSVWIGFILSIISRHLQRSGIGISRNADSIWLPQPTTPIRKKKKKNSKKFKKKINTSIFWHIWLINLVGFCFCFCFDLFWFTSPRWFLALLTIN